MTEEAKDTRSTDAHKRVEGWIRRTNWSSLLLTGFGVLIAHRLIGATLGMRAWVSVITAVAITMALFGWKLWLVGPDSLKTEFRERWQRLSDWLAVVGWWRLIFVSLFGFIAAGIASDALSGHGEFIGLVFAAILVLIATKIARGAQPRNGAGVLRAGDEAKSVEIGPHGIDVVKRHPDGSIAKQVKIGVEGVSVQRGAGPASASAYGADIGASETEDSTRSWLQRLTWGRLMLIGLLLLIAAGIANSLIKPEKHSVVKIIRSDNADSSASMPAPPKAPVAPKAPMAPNAPMPSPAPEAHADAMAEAADAAADAADAVADAADASAPVAGQSTPKAHRNKDSQDVKIGPRGIEVIERDVDGKVSQHVKIGIDGIKVTDGGDNTDVDISVPELRSIPGLTPEKAKQIEDRIRDEVEAASERAQDTQRTIDFAPIAFLVVVSLAIMKLLAGGKRRAELDAGSARVAADMARLEREAADAKLHAMQAQIEPHFLFNTLASVDQLIRTDPQRASQVQKTLIQYLRAAIPQMRDDAQRSTLGRQVKMSQAYLEIMQVRMEERLAFSFDAPEGLSCAEFPSMMLQTLIENCIKHGLEPKPEGGRIDVKAEVARGKLRVKVSDTGVGFTADAKDGVGLANIRERLRLLYGNTASLTLTPNEGGGTVATIELPYRDDDAQQTKVC
ncbi:sensor histidine kinase [Niveibacterium sp.]|uniref:sensor histidine kinase n=1 Tax=Niveibacterium sp. TaxID=2017444 RepID=UPI0035ADD1DE